MHLCTSVCDQWSSMLQPRRLGRCGPSLLLLLTVLGRHSQVTSTGPVGPLPAPALRSISRGSSQQQAALRLMQVRLMLLPKYSCLLVVPDVPDLMFVCTIRHSCSEYRNQ